jgi:hypothetical protein
MVASDQALQSLKQMQPSRYCLPMDMLLSEYILVHLNNLYFPLTVSENPQSRPLAHFP